MARQRPLSPHLQVYRPQLTSMMSITHRATGVALTTGTLVLAAWLVAVALGGESYAKNNKKEKRKSAVMVL